MIRITHIDTACTLIDINGYRILTDPTFDKPGRWYYHGSGGLSKKTEGPAMQVDDLPPIDIILLSHHQHKDNFDTEGKKFARSIPVIISTRDAARKFQNVRGLDNWEYIIIEDPRVEGLRITAVPARHHPWWVPETLAGKVLGFIIQYDAQKNGAIYITGDTVYFDGMQLIAERFRINIGIFHVGAAQFRYLTGCGKYTMDARQLVKAVIKLNPQIVIPVHQRGWSHFKQKEATLNSIIHNHPATQHKTVFLIPGSCTTFNC